MDEADLTILRLILRQDSRSKLQHFRQDSRSKLKHFTSLPVKSFVPLFYHNNSSRYKQAQARPLPRSMHLLNHYLLVEDDHDENVLKQVDQILSFLRLAMCRHSLHLP